MCLKKNTALAGLRLTTPFQGVPLCPPEMLKGAGKWMPRVGVSFPLSLPAAIWCQDSIKPLGVRKGFLSIARRRCHNSVSPFSPPPASLDQAQQLLGAIQTEQRDLSQAGRQHFFWLALTRWFETAPRKTRKGWLEEWGVGEYMPVPFFCSIGVFREMLRFHS